MDETRRRVLLAELEDAKRELEGLGLFIETLSKRLGIDPDTSPTAEQAGPTDAAASTQEPSTLIYPNEFVGLSLPKAAEAVLMRFSPAPNRRPLKTVELTNAIRKGGLQVANSSQLYRSLHKHARFRTVGRGVWGLDEWYPGPRKPSRQEQTVADSNDGADASSVDGSPNTTDRAQPVAPDEG